MGRRAAKQKAAVPVVWKCELAAFHTFHAKPPESHPTPSSGIAITAQSPRLDLALPWGTRPFLVPGTDILLIMQASANDCRRGIKKAFFLPLCFSFQIFPGSPDHPVWAASIFSGHVTAQQVSSCAELRFTQVRSCYEEPKMGRRNT